MPPGNDARLHAQRFLSTTNGPQGVSFGVCVKVVGQTRTSLESDRVSCTLTLPNPYESAALSAQDRSCGPNSWFNFLPFKSRRAGIATEWGQGVQVEHTNARDKYATCV
jgi:hypothetical protein